MTSRSIDMKVVEFPTVPPTTVPVSGALVISGRGIVVFLTLPDGLEIAAGARIKIDGTAYKISAIETTRLGRRVSRDVGLVVIPVPISEATEGQPTTETPALEWSAFAEWNGQTRYVAPTKFHKTLAAGYTVYSWNEHWRIEGLRSGDIAAADTAHTAKDIAQKDYADRCRLQAWENYMLTHEPPPLENL